ncbi:MAG: hemolysin family protein [Chloroflexi bacterium]|nr:hemolysin family protein [Chloroflexota bacterium]
MLAGVVLVVVAAAEASVSTPGRLRLRPSDGDGLHAHLRSYVRQRHRILRSLSAASSVAIVVATVSTGVLVLGGSRLDGAEMLVVALLAGSGAVILRQSARMLALQGPEAAGLRLARLIRLIDLGFAAVAWGGSLPARLVLRLVGRDPERGDPTPAQELLGLLDLEEDSDLLAEERRMMRGILEMGDQSVREIMSARTDVTAVSTEASIGDAMRLVSDTGFSRIPLYEEDIDHIVGVVYAKDLIAYLQRGDVAPALRDVARPPYFVPETKRANELLADLRREQVHMAIAVDEYGGTAGVVTVEDLVEEIVGEISDEHDTDEIEIERVSDDEAVIDARLSIDDLNELFGTEIDLEDVDSVGGLVVSSLGRLAVPGDEVATDDDALTLQVLSILGRRIKQVRVTRAPRAGEHAVAAEPGPAER